MGKVTFEELVQADHEAARRFPSKRDPGLGTLGLILAEPLRNGGYLSTPANSVAFAHTGGGGTHFSFLLAEASSCDESPVIVTIPEALGSENFVVGENLYDFLCLGMHRGFFALEQLGYRFEECVRVYADPAWRAETQLHHWVGYHVDDGRRAMLAFLSKRFGLLAWKNVEERLADLGSRYRGRLIMPNEYPRFET